VLALPNTPLTAPTIVAMTEDAVCERTEGRCCATRRSPTSSISARSRCRCRATLPTGLMLVARNGHDRHLLRIAAEVEALLGG
jgi:aspartyl-tRNA(Asn)/glutamyl-tRNA(Gln) amidotransferase subunit A